MSRKGTTLIDLVMSIAIIALLFGGVYLVYFSIETAIANVSVRAAATQAINNEIELIRNLPYASVGTVSGIPNGVIPQSQTVTQGNFTFTLQTTILNIQDPYDTSPSSSPVADYKLVDITASCPLCTRFIPIEITTTVAPSLLAQGTVYGSIFVYAIDANGQPVSNANIQIVNASVTPSINLTDTTNASGVLKLIGVPTSSQGYQIFASKAGYSSAQTYPVGGASNPNPVQPNITVASQTVSNLTFAIDRMSSLAISTANNRCQAIGNESFSIAGAKLIGTGPDVLKFSTSSKTNASGTVNFSSLEWDTYSLALSDAGKDVVGTIPLNPITINPSTSQTFAFILQGAADPSLLVTTEDSATGAGVTNAQVTLTRNSVSQMQVTGQATFSQTDWSASGTYSSASGIDTSQAGVIGLLANATSGYATTTSWLVSNTFDVGGSSSTFNTITWSPASEPTSTMLQFQVAANNDNATWNFIGPDGSAGTFFTATGSLPAALSGNRYFRYKVYMSTGDASTTPQLTGLTVNFTANCVPPYQVLFGNLAQANYSYDAIAPNYNETSGTVLIGSGSQPLVITLTHQ
ncbi:MAG TPA: carboxypeptidase-like regulatory domain-containing protein [Candidatus Paceibacterota bacterium]|nr:carboxypeptidase-like regulatory domain-containing protein [Candidatus Paceibacterota bacterium]